MTTVVNNPGTTTDSGNNGAIVAVLLIILVGGVLFYMFGRTALQSVSNKTSTTNSAPATQQPQTVVPNTIDVNVKLEK